MTLLEFCRDFFPGEEIFTATEEGVIVHSCRLLDLEEAGNKSGRLFWNQFLPSNILSLLQPGNWESYRPERDQAHQFSNWNGERSFLLTQETLQTLERFHLVIDPQAIALNHKRRPYFRMRGRPVTEEQAFDILCRTNMPPSVGQMDEYPWKNLVFIRGLLDNNWFGMIPHGWVLPNGTIGMNGCSGIKYPDEDEIMADIMEVELAFPYLDLVIAITNWNEAPGYAWKTIQEDDGVYDREDYPDFLEHVICGLWLHDDTVELMAAERAREKYTEYNRLYGGPDEEIFKWHYYDKNKLCPIDTAYLHRMVRAHGLDPEKVLAGFEWGPFGLQKRPRGPRGAQGS